MLTDKGLVRLVAGLSHQDVVAFSLDLGLHGLLVQHVNGLVDPAALIVGILVNLAHSRPESHGTVTYRWLGSGSKAARSQRLSAGPPIDFISKHDGTTVHSSGHHSTPKV